MWIVVGLLAGMLGGLFANVVISPEFSKYVAIAILACIDTVVGAGVAHLQKTFDVKIFFSGFFMNAFIAAAFTYIGSLLNFDMAIAATLVFGTRIFNNFAVMRRLFFSKIKIESKENSKN
ncbi:MAG: small basic family protein [Clostridia bacterium]|nr:small basic family protein [Clostridia bacterium]